MLYNKKRTGILYHRSAQMGMTSVGEFAEPFSLALGVSDVGGVMQSFFSQTLTNVSGSVEDWVQHGFPLEKNLHLKEDPCTEARVTLITDCLSPGSMFGAVGTSILMAVWWAVEKGASLRIVTLSTPVEGRPVEELASVLEVPLPNQIQYTYLPREEWSLTLRSSEGFLCASWWTIRLLKQSGVPTDRIVGLLQEDERLLVPHGDAWLRCEETLRDPDLRIVVNTHFLYQAFEADGFTRCWAQSDWFEPAFPPSLFHASSRERERPRFGFYARPHHDRNLFLRGMEAIQRAYEEGAIPQDWELVLLGPEPLDITMTHGKSLRCPGRLSWEAYAREIRSLHAGMALILTPHPGYPALDMVASGVAVVSNRYGPKQDLSGYNGNLFTRDPDVESLVDGIRCAVLRSQQPERLEKELKECGLSRSWVKSFSSLHHVLPSD